jgi:predicted Fe-Mo cluster-binding NifX family protein
MTQRTFIAVAAEDNRGLQGQVSMHFGRCPYFTVVEVLDGAIQGARAVENPHYGNHQPGAVPQFIHSLGANVILAGGMGPRAVQMFHGFGIDVATGAIGRVDKVLGAYLSGELSGIVPCQHDHPESCGGHSN